jgi:mRNA-degrading endonuclease RelE of RelBE toxin-antitoxin system
VTSDRRHTFSPRADRDARKLDPTTRRVFEALDRLVEEPPRGDVKKLRRNDTGWRLRVGDWRVRCIRDPETRDVYVLRFEPRGRAYR